jgi:hypothetical protein
MNVLSSSQDIDWMRQAAEIEALLELKDQSVNLGVAFAEAKQTANLVTSTAKSLTKAVGALRRKDFGEFLRSLGAPLKPKYGREIRQGRNPFNNGMSIPQKWLEHQYAWKPLLNDVYGSMEALKQQPRHAFIMTAKGSKWISDEPELWNHPMGGVTICLSGERRSGYFVRLDYEPGNVFFDSLSRVGLTNPLEVAWELVPFSFVADWFIPVGDWLRSFDAALGWEFKGGSCSRFEKATTVRTQGLKEGPTGSASEGFLHGKFRGSSKQVRLDRTVYGSSPIPRPPRFKNPVSTTHVANALSLLVTAFGRK